MIEIQSDLSLFADPDLDLQLIVAGPDNFDEDLGPTFHLNTVPLQM
jgi:hypothetical protein